MIEFLYFSLFFTTNICNPLVLWKGYRLQLLWSLSHNWLIEKWVVIQKTNEYFIRSCEMCITGLDLAELLNIWCISVVLILFFTSIYISLLHASVHVYVVISPLQSESLFTFPFSYFQRLCSLIFHSLSFTNMYSHPLFPLFIFVSLLSLSCLSLTGTVQLFYPVEPLASQRALSGFLEAWDICFGLVGTTLCPV